MCVWMMVKSLITTTTPTCKTRKPPAWNDI